MDDPIFSMIGLDDARGDALISETSLLSLDSDSL